MQIKAILCVGPDNIIGTSDNILPWHSRSDFQYFQSHTMGYPCIFGANTYFHLPQQPLKGRLNCVLSRSFAENGRMHDGHMEFNDIDELISNMIVCGYNAMWVCGGARIYDDFVRRDLIDCMYVTHISSDKLRQRIQRTPDSFVRLTQRVSDIFSDTNKWRATTLDVQTDKEYELCFKIYNRQR